jgi:hypothetical protein
VTQNLKTTPLCSNSQWSLTPKETKPPLFGIAECTASSPLSFTRGLSTISRPPLLIFANIGRSKFDMDSCMEMRLMKYCKKSRDNVPISRNESIYMASSVSCVEHSRTIIFLFVLEKARTENLGLDCSAKMNTCADLLGFFQPLSFLSGC